MRGHFVVIAEPLGSPNSRPYHRKVSSAHFFSLYDIWLIYPEWNSLHFNSHFPGGPGLATTRMYLFILEVVVL